MNKFDMRYLLLLVATCMVAVGGFAQRTERDFIRRGNKLYEDSLFIKAEVEYRRALDANPQSMAAMYNLGNALLEQQKAEVQPITSAIADNVAIEGFGFAPDMIFSRLLKVMPAFSANWALVRFSKRFL